uniref:Uncharacterized protein n=1 Tax=Opuntia streptacantha TaxID=393608 RepID=A0A7C9DR04_OPUST
MGCKPSFIFLCITQQEYINFASVCRAVNRSRTGSVRPEPRTEFRQGRGPRTGPGQENKRRRQKNNTVDSCHQAQPCQLFCLAWKGSQCLWDGQKFGTVGPCH